MRVDILDCTSGLVIEVWADVVILHGCPQSCMPNSVESPLEVYEDMVEVLLSSGDISHIECVG